MASKPLKLKKFISEKEAAQLLSQLISEVVSSEEMADYANSGVVPAYISFPTTNHPGVGFYLLSQSDTYDKSITDAPHCGDNCVTNYLPYPLRPNWEGMYKDTKGNFVQANIEAADGSLVRLKNAEHYPRIYSPSEICKVAQILNDPSSCPEWPAVTHACGPFWSGFNNDHEVENEQIVSPYDWAKYSGSELPDGSNEDVSERRVNWPLIVAAMWEELRDEWKKQGTLATKIGARGWKGARKDDVNHALSKANKAKEIVEQ
ncbi:hypothetical protein SAMN05421862_105203 [Pseudomonas extremaustralis]|uniref:hypothetical protein n=1 Tax=Pseudomonas extremaustralis TaxID=359110 RepID=UPI00099D9095|nr:hypothetical protein [Pseudomonas extremaustralis]SKA88462.1 hypothetical protein SAMN05421862_105203 [Pseudomonas extremaustralis]